MRRVLATLGRSIGSSHRPCTCTKTAYTRRHDQLSGPPDARLTPAAPMHLHQASQHAQAATFPPDASSAERTRPASPRLAWCHQRRGGARVAACGARGPRGRTSGNACMHACTHIETPSSCVLCFAVYEWPQGLGRCGLASWSLPSRPSHRGDAEDEAAGACHNDVHDRHLKARHDHDEVPAAMCFRCRAPLSPWQSANRCKRRPGARHESGYHGAGNARNRVPQLYECKGLRRGTQSQGKKLLVLGTDVCMAHVSGWMAHMISERRRSNKRTRPFREPLAHSIGVQLHRRLGRPLHGHTARVETAALKVFSPTAPLGAEMAA